MQIFGKFYWNIEIIRFKRVFDKITINVSQFWLRLLTIILPSEPIWPRQLTASCLTSSASLDCCFRVSVSLNFFSPSYQVFLSGSDILHFLALFNLLHKFLKTYIAEFYQYRINCSTHSIANNFQWHQLLTTKDQKKFLHIFVWSVTLFQFFMWIKMNKRGLLH